MKSHRRGFVIVGFALTIAVLLIAQDVSNKRSVDEYNRSQSREKIACDGSWVSGVVSWRALGIAVIEGRAVVIAMRRDRAARKEAP